MRHSIVTWDSSFRSFFHLLPTLAAQDFDRAMVEVVLIEQRSRKTALEVAAATGVRPAEAVCEAVADRLAVDLVLSRRAGRGALSRGPAAQGRARTIH